MFRWFDLASLTGKDVGETPDVFLNYRMRSFSSHRSVKQTPAPALLSPLFPNAKLTYNGWEPLSQVTAAQFPVIGHDSRSIA